MRWGELIALRPRHIDFLAKSLTVEETIIEVSRQHSPTGERYVTKPYPKSNEPRTFGVDDAWLDAVALHIQTHHIGRDQPLFTTTAGTPISRNTFRTRIWIPAVKASAIDFAVRMHDLRHAHASWLLAEGSDLRSVMERMGHAQIQTPSNTSTHSPKPTARTSTPSPEHANAANGLNEPANVAGSLTQGGSHDRPGR